MKVLVSGSSGLIGTALISALQAVAGVIDDGMYCGLIPGFAHTITGSQDIMLDGTNVQGFSFDGVSIGIAFTADEIRPPSVVGAPPNPVDAGPGCPTDGGPK